MVVIIQIILFSIAFFIRGRLLSGNHLRPFEGVNSGVLWYQSSHLVNVKHVGIIQENGVPFVIGRERWYHRLLKAIGLASELQLGHTEFDYKYYIVTDFPDRLGNEIHKKKLVKYLTQLFNKNIIEIHSTTTRIWCVVDTPTLNNKVIQFIEYIDLLRRISATTSVTNFNTFIRQKNNLGLTAFFIISLHFGLFIMGFVGFAGYFSDDIQIMDTYNWINLSIICGMLAGFAWLLFLTSAFRNTSWLCWLIADFILIGALGFGVSAFHIIRDINVSMPQIPRELHLKVIQNNCMLECVKSCGKRCQLREEHALSPSQCVSSQRLFTAQEWRSKSEICYANTHFIYSVTLQKWIPRGLYTFNASEFQYDTLKIGSIAELNLWPGYLGIPWIDTSTIKAVR